MEPEIEPVEPDCRRLEVERTGGGKRARRLADGGRPSRRRIPGCPSGDGGIGTGRVEDPSGEDLQTPGEVADLVAGRDDDGVAVTSDVQRLATLGLGALLGLGGVGRVAKLVELVENLTGDLGRIGVGLVDCEEVGMVDGADQDAERCAPPLTPLDRHDDVAVGHRDLAGAHAASGLGPRRRPSSQRSSSSGTKRSLPPTL